MKIVIAMDSFKGSCTALAACNAVRKGVLCADPDAEVVCIPVADGGEGTTAALIADGRGEWRPVEVTSPLGARVQSGYGVLDGHIAVIEMCAASGILLVKKEELNPMIATTYGTGELIRAALDAGLREFIVGLGGSATNDGGAGMAQALGVSLTDADGNELPRGGAALARLAKVDVSKIDPRLKECRFTVASDVRNPLCGENGATYVFGGQKGATDAMKMELDNALRHYADVLRDQLDVDVAERAGAGAAGGMGAAMYAFLNAQFRSGIEVVLETLRFSDAVRGADLVFTGEGRTDRQTQFGKVPVGVASAAKAVLDVPVCILCGGIGEGAEVLYQKGIDGIFAIADGPLTLDDAMRRVEPLLARTAESVARLMKKR